VSRPGHGFGVPQMHDIETADVENLSSVIGSTGYATP